MKIINRKAHFNYEITDRVEAGLVLLGMEVKSVKAGRIKLEEGFIKNLNGELWLVNVHIPAYQFADARNYQPERSRKLLLHKKEILSLQKKIEGRNLTLIPLSCYNKGPKIKLEIGIGRGKKQWEKREKIKKQDLNKEMARTLRNKF